MVDHQMIQKMVKDLRQARRLIKGYQEIGIPEIERCLRMADMNLHWILWGCGEAVQYLPDLPLED